MIGRSDPVGPLTSDPLGLFAGQINGEGNTASWVYDGANRQIQQDLDLRVDGQGGNALHADTFNPDGKITLQYEYDLNSRLTALIDDKGNRTEFAYDALNRQIQRLNADGES